MSVQVKMHHGDIDKDVIMNCKPVLTVDELPGGANNYLLEPKFDGFRLIVRRGFYNNVDVYTRNGKSQNGKLPWLEAIAMEWPTGTIVDGEIAAPYWDEEQEIYVQDFEQVQSIMLSKPDKSISKAANTRDLTFFGFDMLMYNSEDIRNLPLYERRAALEMLKEDIEDNRFVLSMNYKCEQRIHDQMCAQGFEGSVAKRLDGPYNSGRRGHGWFKLKKQTDIDVIVLDYKPGTRRLEGQVGGVIFGQIPNDDDIFAKAKPEQIHNSPKHGQVIIRGSASGFDDAERLHLTEYWDDYKDTTMTIAHMGVMAGEIRLRHPQFKRWRPDKDAAECTWHNE